MSYSWTPEEIIQEIYEIRYKFVMHGQGIPKLLVVSPDVWAMFIQYFDSCRTVTIRDDNGDLRTPMYLWGIEVECDPSAPPECIYMTTEARET